MKIPVVVDCRSGWIIRYHFRLRRFGLDRAEEKKYRGMVSERRLEHIKEYCREKHLKYYIDNAYGTRDSGYRERFLKSYHPLFGKIYFCAYCGKLLSRRRVTVDHLYPVAKVSRDLELQKRLKRQGIRDLNAVKNLVPACERCNQAKAAQMGKWIRKGKLGRHKWIWVVRWLLRVGLFLLFAVALYLWHIGYLNCELLEMLPVFCYS